MYGETRVAVVMPAHNEERLIERAVARVPAWVDDLLVVDDCSDDRTAERAAACARPGLEVLRHERNRGVGAAIVTGYRRALERGAGVVAVMAGDDQMDPADLPRLLAPVIQGDADYAKGDRLSWPGVFRQMPLARFVGNHVFSRLTRLSSGYREVRDSQCGYTAASARVLARLPLDDLYPRYGYPNDLLARLNAVGARLAQVPVRPRYGEERSGISLTTALVRIPLLLAACWLRRWRSRRALAPLLETARREG